MIHLAIKPINGTIWFSRIPGRAPRICAEDRWRAVYTRQMNPYWETQD